MNDIKEWLISWFEKNTDAEREELLKRSHESYFEQGLVDSLKFIEFVTDVESAFKVQFSNDEFHDRTFSTITGLTKIIESKKNDRL